MSTATQPTTLPQEATDLVRYAREMLELGLVTGTSGNISMRSSDGIVWVTPSGVDYKTMQPENLVAVDLEGTTLSSGLKPSIDTMSHVAIYRARDDVGCVIHTHSPYAAAFSTLHQAIPALITESGGLLGGDVRVATYVPPATPEKGYMMGEAIGTDRAILLPNHGVMAVGENPKKAFMAATAVEESAHVAFLALQLGKPFPVPDGEIERMNDFIHHRYGQR